MLSSVLNSDRAIQVNIQIMRIFTKMREMLLTHKDLVTKIEQMESPTSPSLNKIKLVQASAWTFSSNHKKNEKAANGFCQSLFSSKRGEATHAFFD